MLAVYAIVNGNEAGWTSARTLGLLGGAAVLLAAMSEVGPTESGLASGMVNTAVMMGGALGLAILASLAASHTGGLLAEGAIQPVALVGGYQAAFLAGACFAALAAVLGATLLPRPPAAHPSGEAESVTS